MPLQDFLQQHIAPQQQNIQRLKQQWLAQEAEIQALILAELEKTYPKGEKKRLKRTTFKSQMSSIGLKSFMSGQPRHWSVD